MKSRSVWLSIIFCLLATIDYIRKNKNQIKINNVCDNWFSYYNFYFSSHCHYNPDADSSVGEIIERLIGVSEFHEVPTEDGFILGVFRMPRKNPKGVILFQHPLSVDSKIWFLQENMSTAYLFWKAGYDIWLGNNRGTTYSQKHVSLKPEQAEFWNYSFHEIGYYDHPACTSYIKNVTKASKIIFLGQSMAATSSLIFASLRPEQARQDVKVFINMSPSALFNYSTSKFTQDFELQLNFLEKMGYSLFGRNHIHTNIYNWIFSIGPLKLAFVSLREYWFGGKVEEFDPRFAETLFSFLGSEVSIKTCSHFLQLMNEKQFQMYNYGEKLNLELYGSAKPILYPIENITAPFYFIYSTADKLINFTDVEILYDRMFDKAKTYGKKQIDSLGHIDFHVGIHRNTLVYEPLIKFLDSLNN